jgi:hypothetical protein
MMSSMSIITIPSILADASNGATATASAIATSASTVAATTRPATAMMTLPDRWPAQVDLLKGCQSMPTVLAVFLVVGGLTYLLWGFRYFHWLVLLNAATIGTLVGYKLGVPYDAAIPCAIIGAFIAGAITWQSMKYSIAVMGGLFGALLGASLWRAAGLEPHFAWSGAGMGLILFGLLCFIIFRESLMMYMSLQGAVMVVFGALGLIYKMNEVGPVLTEKFNVTPFLLPMAIFIPAIVGIIYQQQTTMDLAGVGGASAPPPPPPKK